MNTGRPIPTGPSGYNDYGRPPPSTQSYGHQAYNPEIPTGPYGGQPARPPPHIPPPMDFRQPASAGNFNSRPQIPNNPAAMVVYIFVAVTFIIGCISNRVSHCRAQKQIDWNKPKRHSRYAFTSAYTYRWQIV